MAISRLFSHLRAIISLALIFIINIFPHAIFVTILICISNPHTWEWVQKLIVLLKMPINEKSAIFVLMMLAIFAPVAIAFLPFTPRLMAFFSGWKKADGEYKEYIRACLAPVCETAGRNINKINLYVMDSNEINAAAFGINNILVFRGAIAADQNNPGFLCGILAHELGHLEYRHGIKTTFLYMITLGASLSIRFINFCVWITKPLAIIPYINFVYALFMFCFNLIIGAFNGIAFLTDFIMLWFSRMDEHAADKYACDIGYGWELLNSLELLKRSTWLPEKKGFFANIGEDHPSLPHRIETIREYLDKHTGNIPR